MMVSILLLLGAALAVSLCLRGWYLGSRATDGNYSFMGYVLAGAVLMTVLFLITAVRFYYVIMANP